MSVNGYVTCPTSVCNLRPALLLPFLYIGTAGRGQSFHNLHHFVERYLVCPVSQHGIRIGIHGTGGSIGIALDAGDLHQTANRVAGQSQMVFQSHFGCIFDLCRCASEQLGCGSGRHGTSYAHFSLASYFSTGYGCIFFTMFPKGRLWPKL